MDGRKRMVKFYGKCSKKQKKNYILKTFLSGEVWWKTNIRVVE